MKDQLLSLLDIEKNDLFFMHTWLTDHDHIDHIPYHTRLLMQMSYCYKKNKNAEHYLEDLHQSIEELINFSKRDKRLHAILERMFTLDKKKFFII